MDFVLVDSVLHLKDGKKGHAGIFSQMGLDVCIPSHIYYWANDTRRICTSAKKYKKAKKKEGSVYSVRAGFDHFLVILISLEISSPLTFMYKMT